MSFSLLSADIVDSILTTLTDFKSLSAFLRTSNKLVYQVFQNRPRSIVAAISQNVTGPAYAQALRLVHLNVLDYGGRDDFDDILDENEAVNKVALTRDSAELLEKYAEVTYNLLDLFSLRYKDRTSPTSQLTPVEATRFLVALYRVWFVVSFLDSCTPPYRLRHSQWSVPAVPNADFTDEWDVQLSVQTSSLLQPFILSSEGMQSIYDIAYFLTEVIRWVACSRQRRYQMRTINVVAPDLVWESYQMGYVDRRSILHTRIANTADVFEKVMRNIWSSKGVDEVQYQQAATRGILDSVEGEEDTCCDCGAEPVGGLELWGATNGHLWFRGKNAYEFGTVFLPGNLGANADVLEWIEQHLFGPDVISTDFKTMIAELLVFAREDEGHVEVSEHDAWYCTGCMDGFLQRHFWKWMLAYRRREEGYQKEDCCYGYDCFDMAFHGHHACALNHLCMPTTSRSIFDAFNIQRSDYAK